MTNVWVKEEIKLEFENIDLNQEDKSWRIFSTNIQNAGSFLVCIKLNFIFNYKWIEILQENQKGSQFFQGMRRRGDRWR